MKTKIVLIVIVSIFIITPGAYAWDNSVHEQMVKDAIALCPKELRLFLKQHIDLVINGSKEPTIALTSPTSYAYGYRNSYYVPYEEKGNAPNETKIVALSVIDLLSKKSQEEDLIARRMGLICSYASDSIQPKRYIGVAPNYPLDYLVEEKRLTITYNGHNAIDDFSTDLKSLVKGTWDKDLTDEQYYDLAVNYIVDAWVTIWEKSGLPPGEMIAIGSQIRPVSKKDLEEAEEKMDRPEAYFDLEKLDKANVYKDIDLKKYEGEEGYKVDMDKGGTEPTKPEEMPKPESEPDEGGGDSIEKKTSAETEGEATEPAD